METTNRCQNRFAFTLLLMLFAPTASGQSNLAAFDTSISTLAEYVLPSVVLVESNAYEPVGGAASGGQVAIQSSTGSGVIISSDGFIVTNAHVVSGATLVEVQMAYFDGPVGQSVLRPRGRRLEATITGIDLETDLALLKIEATDLRVLEFADSEAVRQGQLVLALGSPLGLENSVTMGIVSSVARQLEPDDRMIYIQTDAPINPGNSGGPLVDTAGRLVGINTMILSPSGASAGVGLAVPSNIVNSVVEQLLERGSFVRGDIGVQAQTITPELSAGLGLERDYGVVLSDVFPGGSAYNGDVWIGDIVLRLNEKPMENARQFMVNLYAQPPNGRVLLEVLREGEILSRPVAVRVRNDEPQNVARYLNMEQRRVSRLGILAVPVDDNLRGFLPVPRLPGGVMVTGVTLSADAPRDLFLSGEIIYSVNGEALASVDELESRLSPVPAGVTVVIQVERDRRLSYVLARLY